MFLTTVCFRHSEMKTQTSSVISSWRPSLLRACRVSGSQRYAASTGELLKAKEAEGPQEGTPGGPSSKTITGLSEGSCERRRSEEETEKPEQRKKTNFLVCLLWANNLVRIRNYHWHEVNFDLCKSKTLKWQKLSSVLRNLQSSLNCQHIWFLCEKYI